MRVKQLEAKAFSENVLKNIATLGFIGYLPLAPGTWGSAAALIIVLLWKLSILTHLLIIVAGTIIGIFASDRAEGLIGETDSRYIVIDEFIGFLISVFYLPQTYGYIIAAFFLFRFFDILKPFPIRKIGSILSGGKGIMADDIVAALYTNLILQIWKLI
ncbi:MAG: phosphatidylglycerophosphatase A [Nitrospirota bacterium]